MSQQLINHSTDLKKLRDEGYEIEIKGGFLLVHHIPYVNPSRQIKYGTLVSHLNLANNITTARPNTHVIYFMGEYPCHKDGTRIDSIYHSASAKNFGAGIIVQHSFSNKPKTGYVDHYHKVSRYADIISAPAKSLDHNVTEKTFKLIKEEDPESVFEYVDTNSSRANIAGINRKFNGQKIAIVGLGGTGSYILDLVAKTEVDEIHLFDADDFLQHNAFRSPGAASGEQLLQKMKKVEYFRDIYTKMHRHVIAHSTFVNSENLSELDKMNYVFICVDKNGTRKLITDHLLCKGIAFIDTGLGILQVEDSLIGTVRLTTGTASKNDHFSRRVSGEDFGDEDEYSTNIQIADLNALNASLAVIKWKKLTGFYQDLEKEHHTTYSLNVSHLLNEDTST